MGGTKISTTSSSTSGVWFWWSLSFTKWNRLKVANKYRRKRVLWNTYLARTATWESPPYGTNSVCLSSISLAAEAFKSDQPTGIVVVVVTTVSCCSSISSIFIICEVFIVIYLSRAVPHTEQRLAVILSPARGLSFLEANLYSSAPSVVSLVTTVRLRWGSSTLL